MALGKCADKTRKYILKQSFSNQWKIKTQTLFQQIEFHDKQKIDGNVLLKEEIHFTFPRSAIKLN